jgi:hypothetical protein
MAGVERQALELKGLEIGFDQAGPTTDNDLVREFIAGNEAAFTQLVTKYKDPITNYINVMVGDYDVAIDLSQETFLRVYKNITRYSNIYQFSTWIYRIATNLAIDEMRYRRRRAGFAIMFGPTALRSDSRPGVRDPDVRLGPPKERIPWGNHQVPRRHPVFREIPHRIHHEEIRITLRNDCPALKCSAGTMSRLTGRVNCRSASSALRLVRAA